MKQLPMKQQRTRVLYTKGIMTQLALLSLMKSHPTKLTQKH